MKELTEGEIIKQAIAELSFRGFEMWRSKQPSKKGRQFLGKKGAADITGYHRYTGIRCECEIKTIGDSLSDDQKNFLHDVQNAGGYALIAHDNGNGGIYISSIAEYMVRKIIS